MNRKLAFIVASLFGVLGNLALAQPVRLADGRPLVGTYFFGHWWDPWRSNDAPMDRDLATLRDMGVNTLFCDHEPSQSWDHNWEYLDREHKFAKKYGMQILPWLELKCGSDLAAHHKEAESRFWYPVPLSTNQLGEPCNCKLWHKAYQDMLFDYICEYIERYRQNGTILTLLDADKQKLAIAPSVEVGWDNSGFDTETLGLFRGRLKHKYGDLTTLNRAWGTGYKHFAEIDARDKTIFDYAFADKQRMPQAVIDHAYFRAEVINKAMSALKSRLLRRYPDLVIVAEVPYPFGWIAPPSLSYKWKAASFPETVEYADLIVFRTAGPSSVATGECDKLLARGQKLLLAHRTGQGGLIADLQKQSVIDAAARQALEHANGIGFYSWNEMGDCPIVGSREERGFVSTYSKLFHRYLQLAGSGGKS